MHLRARARLVLRRAVRGFLRTASADAAAALTFYAVLAVFPTIVAALSLVSVVGKKGDAITAVLDGAREMLPPDVIAAVSQLVERAASTAGGGWVLVLSLAVALWSVTRYVTALGRAINRAYGVPEGRVLWKAKPIQLLITLLVFVLVAAAGVLAAVSWPLAQALGRAWGAGDLTLLVWRVARWPAVVILVVLVVAVLYYFAPNIRHPHFRLVSVGAVVAIAIFALASLGFGFYVTNLADYGEVYGSFAGIMIFLIWLWLGNIALLLGVFFDAELERLRELHAGVPAESELQVPLRDSEKLKRDARNAQQDAAEARRFRGSRR